MKTSKYSSKISTRHLVILLCVFLHSIFSRADVLFEGYYKIFLSGVHSGYAIQKYELNAAKKEFTSTYYLYVRTSPDGSKSNAESLIAVSDDGFKPKSYQYTALLNGSPMTIDASFVKDKIQAKVMKDGKPQSISQLLPKGSFLSTMLLYMVLQKGLKTGAAYSFNAVAEEDGQIYPGNLKVIKEDTYKGHSVFKLEYDFKGIPSMAFVSFNGNVLYTEATAQRVETELVTSPSDARVNFPFAEKTITKLFGGIPAGQINFLVEKQTARKSSPTPTPEKTK